MNRTIRNIIIGWGLYLILVIVITLNVSNPFQVGGHMISIFLLQLIIFSLNYFILAPKLLEQKKVLIYFIVIGVALLVFSYVGVLISDYIHNMPQAYPDDHEPKGRFIILARFFPNLMAVIISNLILKADLLNKVTQEKLELKNKILEAESMALKAQINPHFLFNALNNIYALSQIESQKTGDAILQLSHLLSYVTYEADKKYVNLTDEIQYIEHFIELQLLKNTDHSNIHVNIQNPIPDYKICPLLLIPLVENAFKHGNVFDKNNGWIKIDLYLEDEVLILTVANTVSAVLQQKDRIGGVGLDNVKKRLDLLYKNKYDLAIKDDLTSYQVALKINLSK